MPHRLNKQAKIHMGAYFSGHSTSSNYDQEREIQGTTRIESTTRTPLQRVKDYIREITIVSSVLDSCLSSPITPRIPSSLRRSSGLAAIADQAKLNGWYIEPHEIEFKEQVGQGSTAVIYRGLWKGNVVAVKCIHPEFFYSNDNRVTFFVQEIDTLSRQDHPYVLRIMGACLDPPEFGWMVTEFVSKTLKQWLHGPDDERRKERSIPLHPLQERVAKALEISEAMEYLHGQNPKLVHRDLKPSNIFLDHEMHVRVADFGHARFLEEGDQAQSGETGTYVHMAPEVIRFESYDEKCDVYSYGVVLNELITGEHPYIETDFGPSKV
ncbi:serine/threonine-protein kinase STY13-like [Papaver somniferum]|uniref:serine/threonine-protein kinase STY13-like n=1 Tax=Papaver somniferum TaxID=3469 RepID=UPI000E6F5DAD|nr:serine/threonine-protein kinase STY13-like [Papaver somniferum]